MFVSSASVLAAGSVTYDYDSLGRLAKVTYANGNSVTYSYDAAGNRTLVVSVSNGQTGGGNGGADFASWLIPVLSAVLDEGTS
ncbi:RHS repeat domain-containing protein [Aquirhabdus sp.]|uniref:RHS repeat domain-containing protein n=1 Tax=Aquirhabdus sp. TaxID=2824160 RepID=UPI00396CCE1C